MNATNTMLLWNPRSGAVMLKPWPELDRLHSDYRSGLACYVAVRKASFEQRKTMVLIEAMHLIVRDGIDPQKLHTVLLGLDEYRDACASDMPGVVRHD
jgi:hypothetical protein